MKAKYIKTMDFDFENVEILNCNTPEELAKKIQDSDVIKINNDGIIEYINSTYIMFYELYQDNILKQNMSHIPRID